MCRRTNYNGLGMVKTFRISQSASKLPFYTGIRFRECNGGLYGYAETLYYNISMKYKIYTLTFDGVVRYIGYTKKSLNERKLNHIKEMKEAERKKRNWNKRLSLIKSKKCMFDISLIDEFESKEEALFFESYWICQFIIWGFSLVNMTAGGDGGDTFSTLSKTRQDSIREKISKKNKGKIRSTETIEKWKSVISGDNHWTRRLGSPMKDKKHTKESREKISKAKRGIKISEDVRKARLGKVPNNFGKSKYPGVIKLDKNTLIELESFNSIGEAVKSLGKPSNYGSKLKECCEGTRKTMCKFAWKYDIVHSVPD